MLGSLALFASVAVFGQSAPLQTGSPLYNAFTIPTVNGTLHYALSASDRLTIGYSDTEDLLNAATISADVGFLSASRVHPFRLTFSGGYLATTGSGQPSAFFTSLMVSQEYNTKYWKFTVEDTFRYLPDTPSTGLSGLNGLGDLGIQTGVDPSQETLTPFATRIDNSVSLQVSRVITGSTSLNATGYFAIQRFPGDPNGLETDNATGRATVFHRLDARTSITGDYTFTQFSYVSKSGEFLVNSGTVGIKRKLTKKIEVDGAIGPERINSLALNGRPPSLNYSANAHLVYAGNPEHNASVNLSFVRSTTSGSGVTFGAQSNTFAAGAGRSLTRSLSVTGEARYTSSDGFQIDTGIPLDTSSFIASGEINRAIGRTLSIFASYTLQHQTFSGTYQGLQPLTGNPQILGIGLTYSPSELLLGRQ